MTEKATVYFAGVPTAPAVQAIRDAYPNLKPGDVVRYDALEKIIGEPRSANRWKTVASKWRHRIEVDDNLMTRAIPNTGYEVLDAKGRIETAANQWKQGVWRIKVAGHRAVETDPEELDEAGRHTRLHLIEYQAKIGLARRVSPKPVVLPAPPQA